MASVTRDTTNVALPAEVSAEIWSKTIEESAIMQLANRRTLPGAGVEVQLITGDPTASWVAEADKIPSSAPQLEKKTIKGYKLGVIVPFSNEFRRDKAALYDEMVSRVPRALGQAFDATVFGNKTKPGELFDTLSDATAVDIETSVWEGLVTADAAIATGDGILNGWVMSPKAKSLLLTATDTIGRPLFVNPTQDKSVPQLLGNPTYVKKGVYAAGTPDQLGVAGDWTSAYYGVVEDIKFSISDQSTLTIDGEAVNLWENDMFAVRFVFEAGFRAKFLDHFVKLTGKN